jgi:outer membrane receptor for ferrienterochelin and colicins
LLKKFTLFVFFPILSPLFLFAQNSSDTQNQNDSLKQYEINPIVITATKTEKTVEDSPIPVSLVSKKEITASGSYKLSEILSEQTGLNIAYFLGAGVQIQGLDPDYALILVDGEPLIGRNGGTIDLSRVSLGNVKQIEIVKGPSSSLYGSEALSGVINIITDKPSRNFLTDIKARYGTFNTVDLNGNIEYKKNNLGLSLFANFNRSNGYDLFPESIAKTSPSYNDYTFNPVIKYDVNKNLRLELNSRMFLENMNNIATVAEGESQINLNDKINLTDINNTLSINYNFTDKIKLKTKLYNSYYNYKDVLTYPTSGNLFFEDMFEEIYSKGELMLEGNYLKNNTTVLGGGIILDKVNADRLYNDSKNANTKFVYFQNEYLPFHNLNITAGVRFDAHSDYASRVSPKLAVLYTPVEILSLKSSFGTGFKAPTFQELYLDFTNPQVGYSVFGTTGFQESMQQLIQSGQISEIYIDLNTVTQIKPENSQAFNFNFTVNPFKQIKADVNFFRNDIKDLIEVLPVAKKTNGQSVFTYFNLSRIYTQGIETNLTINPFDNLNVTLGYQYLDAKDKQVIDDINNQKIYKTGSTGIVRPVQMVEYGGLFNRSKHSGVVKIYYTLAKYDASINLRVIGKSKYGYIDRNGNGILDNDNEYAPGYVLWNSAVSKKIFKNVSLQIGVDNIFDHKNPEITPEFPGRIIYSTIDLTF